MSLRNRLVMAPLTRMRTNDDGRVPNDLMRAYYCQRASAGLIISEATSVSPQGIGYPNTPGIWTSAQIEGWRKITEAVHAKGGKIVLQLWHVGRVSDPEYLSGQIPVAPSPIAPEGYVSHLRPQRLHVTPRALHTEEIARVVADFAAGAVNAREAGFDGVGIHAANGYLIDQFLHDGSNHRTDQYGGSIENRARLLLEIVDACIGVCGADRVGVHLSPCGSAHSMHDTDPWPLFDYLARVLGQRKLAFLFLREARGSEHRSAGMKQIFGGAVIVNGGYNRTLAQQAVSSGKADAVAFGRAFIANPDLPHRLDNDIPLNQWDETTFYTGGPQGYIDYSFSTARSV